MDNQLESFRNLLGARLNPRIKDKFGFTYLHWAAIANHPSAVKYLLENGADPQAVADNAFGTAWDSPSYRRSVSTRTFRQRLSRFDVDIKKHYWGVRELTALHVAASENSVPIINLLHKHGTSFNFSESLGLTPLQVAISSESWEAVDSLIGFGCNINAIDRAHRSLLHWIAFYKSNQRVGILLGGAFPPIYWGQLDPKRAASELLKRNADVSVQDLSGNTALHLAAATDKCYLAEGLLRHSAQVDAKNYALATPLHLAAWFNSLETAKLLLEYGARVDSQDSAGNSPLHIATADDAQAVEEIHIPGGGCCHREGPNAVVKLLVEYGADVVAENSGGFTPLGISKNKRMSSDTYDFLRRWKN